MIAEVHHVLWRRGLVCEEDRARDQHDALCIAAWMSRAYRDGSLAGFLKPQLTAAERTVAEGWILEVPSGIRLGKRGRSDQAPRANNRPRPPHATRGEGQDERAADFAVSPVPAPRRRDQGAQRSAAAETVDGATGPIGPWAAATVASAKMVTAIATIMRANMMPSAMISPTNCDTRLLVASAHGNVQREGWFRQ